MKQFVLKCKNCDAGHLSNNFYYGAAKCIHTITWPNHRLTPFMMYCTSHFDGVCSYRTPNQYSFFLIIADSSTTFLLCHRKWQCCKPSRFPRKSRGSVAELSNAFSYGLFSYYIRNLFFKFSSVTRLTVCSVRIDRSTRTTVTYKKQQRFRLFRRVVRRK